MLQIVKLLTFVQRTEESEVRRQISVKDFLGDSAKAFYTSRNAWSLSQQELSHLSRLTYYRELDLPKKQNVTNVLDLKRYNNVATVARDFLLLSGRIHSRLHMNVSLYLVKSWKVY